MASLAIVSSCQEKEIPETKGNAIKFAKIDRSANSPLAADSEIGLFVSSPVHADNVKLKIDAQGNVSSETEVCWAIQQTTSSDFLAYSPYNASYTGAKSGRFEVAIDQTSASAITASDLLIATACASPEDGEIDFVFEHKNSKISLYFTNNSGEAIKGVEICDVLTEAQISFTNGSVSATGDKGSVKCCLGKDASNKDVYTALIVPQTAKFTVRVTLASDAVVEFPLAEQTAFTSGKQWSNASSPLVLASTVPVPVALSFSVSDWGDGGALRFAGSDDDDDDDYTSIAALAATATSTTADDFSANVKNVVVTFVSGKYAHLEDKTGGIMVFMNSNPCETGDLISGTISGKIAFYDGYAEITTLDLSKATVSTASEIKPTEITVTNLIKDFDKYLNMMVIIKGVTILSGVDSYTSTGQLEQGGTTLQFHSKNKAAEIEEDATGDIIGWPIYYKGTKQIVLYTQDHFIEGSGEDMGEETAFTKTSALGMYALPDETTVTPLYSAGEYAQISSIKSGKTRSFNILDFAEGKGLFCTLDSSSITKGATVAVSVSSLGLDLDGTYSATVLGYSGGKAWLQDSSSKKGFIISIE